MTKFWKDPAFYFWGFIGLLLLGYVLTERMDLEQRRTAALSEVLR